ncbi:MAG: Zn-dependent hydrolase [Bacteroidales bacterium]|jgi:hypothetical protein
MRTLNRIATTFMVVFFFAGCSSSTDQQNAASKGDKYMSNYAEVVLSANLDDLTPDQKQMIPSLIEAAQIVDEIYWKQVCGDPVKWKEKVTDPDLTKYLEINYGPWDRLSGFDPFIEGVQKRPEGANFYPMDMQFVKFEELENQAKYDPYTLIRRNEVGGLQVIPYHTAYREKLEQARSHMYDAAALAEDIQFEQYIRDRGDALLTDEYEESNTIWMQMKDNDLDFLVGPIEDTDDRLFFIKRSYQAMLLKKDKEESRKLEKYRLLLPYLQQNLPIDPEYIRETPGELSDIAVYDVLYCAGKWNAGSKFIALTHPRDPQVQFELGSRRLQFQNVIKAKFKKILKPISELLIDKKQLEYVSADAFAQNTIFYEVGSALGISHTVNGKGSVKAALKEHYTIIEECKNDVLSLFFIDQLHTMGELSQQDIMSNYVTYMADVFRSVRFGITNDQAVANMIRFNYFKEYEAFTRDSRSKRYTVHRDKMKEAMMALANEILMIQATGDYEAAQKLIEEKGYIQEHLLDDLYRLQKIDIPKDVYFKQGVDVLGLAQE